ncbi:hypothetical protein PAL_GLEAN10004988 [Pteropus alecto]|uniref:Uncharacterized protein n=1 Tax=Pteropus alecto TaxID=9402 RepID=L5KMW5_PTEAL|nr:hypothetical protein PAL_GLEAN10004988 [Pteropus alecto]
MAETMMRLREARRDGGREVTGGRGSPPSLAPPSDSLCRTVLSLEDEDWPREGQLRREPQIGGFLQVKGPHRGPELGARIEGVLHGGKLVKAVVHQRSISLASPGPAHAMRGTVTEQVAPGPSDQPA